MGNELQKAIDELRPRLLAENVPYLDCIERAAGDVVSEYARLAIFRDAVAGALAETRHN